MTDNIMTAERTPDVIALEIQTIHSQTQKVLLSGVVEIGRRLCEAKELVPFGEWGSWLSEKVHYSQSTANNFMRVFEEYGADQIGFFGDVKSQALGELGYTKALMLIAVPAEEREEFAAENDVANKSTREVEKLIKERDDAVKNAAAASEREATTAKNLKAITDKAEKLKTDLKKANESTEKYKKELKELQSKPIDVAVQEADPEAIEAAKAEARKQAETELQEKIRKAQEEAEDLKKKLAVAAPEVTRFEALYNEANGLLDKLVTMLNDAAPDHQLGFRKALAALFEAYGSQIGEGAA